VQISTWSQLALVSAKEEAGRLESAIAAVYGGPLEDFIRRRDALAKELRSAGDRELASTVKGLRKPSRPAWALNLGAQGPWNAIEPLASAVGEMIEAQAAGADVRGAIARLRGAVRGFADHAADASERAGYRIEPGVLVNAVLAVLGKPESFNQLRGGYLVEIPEAGGLDFLASLPAPPAPPASRPEAVHAGETASADTSSEETGELATAAREAARQAAGVLADARTRAETAQQGLDEAESTLHAAVERVRHAEAEERAARDHRDRARREAEAAAARLLDAESAVSAAERQISGAIRRQS
jgi:hypothetical protein